MQLLKFEGRLDPTTDRDAHASQLAVDEAMLVWADRQVEHASTTTPPSPTAFESIRCWQFDQPTVVLGRSSKINDETDRQHCDDEGIPILRRCTGGASVVGGPGCLMYAVVLRLTDDRSIRKIDAAHDHVMANVLAAVRIQCPDTQRQGICDLTYRDRKFSGNSLRVARHHLLYHGTILYGADLDAFAKCLTWAPRQPDYRRERDHRDFITNVMVDVAQLQSDLASQFGAEPTAVELPPGMRDVAAELLDSRYRDRAWHERH